MKKFLLIFGFALILTVMVVNIGFSTDGYLTIDNLENIEALAQDEGGGDCYYIWDYNCWSVNGGHSQEWFYNCFGGDGQSLPKPRCPSEITEGVASGPYGQCFRCM